MSHKLVAFSDSIEKWPTLLLILDLGIGGALRAPPPRPNIPLKSPPSLGLNILLFLVNLLFYGINEVELVGCSFIQAPNPRHPIQYSIIIDQIKESK